MDSLATFLREHNFPDLFIDGLGWDHALGSATFQVRDRSLDFRVIAQKRGVQVVVCPVDRTVVRDRGLLRHFQALVAQLWHEHVLIFLCEEPRKQVWLWAIRQADGRRLRHREHPFFSESPPSGFLCRLDGLRFALSEEESVTLLDALHRVRHALDATADLDLFSKHPWYAARSDELARAMQAGGPAAFREFVEFHLPLARWSAKRWHHSLGLDLDEAEQLAVIGLTKAARRFRPEKGFLFATYAWHWLRCVFQTLGPEAALLIQVPGYLFWECRALRRKFDRLLLAEGPDGVDRGEAELEIINPRLAHRWFCVQRALGIRSLSDRTQPEYKQACRIFDSTPDPNGATVQNDAVAPVARAIAKLHPRQAFVIRLRFGFDGMPLSLQAVAEKLDVSKERVRQIQNRAIERLRSWLEEFRGDDQMNHRSQILESAESPQESSEVGKLSPVGPREACGSCPPFASTSSTEQSGILTASLTLSGTYPDPIRIR